MTKKPGLGVAKFMLFCYKLAHLLGLRLCPIGTLLEAIFSPFPITND